MQRIDQYHLRPSNSPSTLQFTFVTLKDGSVSSDGLIIVVCCNAALECRDSSHHQDFIKSPSEQ